MAIADHVLIAFPNYSDANAVYSPTFSGGLWEPTAPLTNLQNRFLAYKARSMDCASDNTQFVEDLATDRGVQVVAIPRHNLSLTATATLNLYDSAMSLLYAETVSAFPIMYPWGSLTFGDPHWFAGTLTAEERELNIYPVPLLWVLDQPVLARYVEVKIVDTENPDGYVELTRLFVSPGWQPTVNAAYGSTIGVQDSTVESVTLGMASIYDQRTKQRVFNLDFPMVPKNEAFVAALDMQTRLGKSGQVFVSLSPSDTQNFHRVSCLMTMAQLSPLRFATYGYQGVAFSFKEVVA